MGFLNEVIESVESMAANPPEEISIHMRNPEVLAVVDEVMGAGTSTITGRPTVNIGIIKGGFRINMIPDSCVFELDIRLPIGLTAEEVMAVIDSIIPRYEKATIEMKKQKAASNPSSFSHITHPMVGIIGANAKTVTPDSNHAAMPSMGATDCKHYRYAGIPAFVYGCSPYSSKLKFFGSYLKYFAWLIGCIIVAMVNESASINEFIEVTKVHVAATWEFLQ